MLLSDLTDNILDEATCCVALHFYLMQILELILFHHPQLYFAMVSCLRASLSLYLLLLE